MHLGDCVLTKPMVALAKAGLFGESGDDLLDGHLICNNRSTIQLIVIGATGVTSAGETFIC